MADVKISQLPAATTPLAGTEQIPLVQSSTTKQITVSNLLTAANLGTPTAINLTNATNVPVNQATGVLPVVNGGNGTATPSLVGGTNITVSGSWPNQTITATGAAAGDVTGPSSATDNAVVRFDNTTGKVIQNSGVIISDANAISGGTWNGATVGVPYGGTGVATLTGLVKGNGTSAFSAATAGTDYVAPGGALGTPSSGTATNLTGLPLSTGVTGTLPVANGGTGTTTPSLVAGSNVTISGTWPNQTIAATGGGGGGGSVTDVSVVSANGLAGTVATSTSTPAITLSTTVTGVVKGNGTALSAATAGTDYVAPGGALGTPSSATLTNATGLPLTTGVTGTLPVANGGTGTATPALVAGTNVTITGTWPNQTINSSGGGSMTYPGAGIANSTGSAWGTSYSTSGSGTTVALTTNPTFVTPVLGTPTSATLTNATGLPISTGVSGLGTGVATALAVNVGSAGAPVVNGGALGTPSSGTLTNATDLPISTGVSGLGTGVATFLATPSSANLASAVTDETGSGSLVFATSPTLVTPVLGTPTSGNFSTGSFTWPTFNQNTTGTAAGLSATLAVASGGTGQTSYTDGQLLIGNSTGNTLTKATLTAGTGISVTNASGSITIAATGGGGGTSIGLVRALAVNCILC